MTNDAHKTHPDNYLDPDLRYWRDRCIEAEDDRNSLREQLQIHVTALKRANMVILDGDLISLNDEEEQ